VLLVCNIGRLTSSGLLDRRIDGTVDKSGETPVVVDRTAKHDTMLLVGPK